MITSSMMTNMPEQPPRIVGLLASSCVFVSALLLFWLQPMMGRIMLPRFGSVASVWIVCLLIYQLLLFFGYAYAHWLCSRAPRLQSRIHGGLLFFTLMWMATRTYWEGSPLVLPDPVSDCAPQWRAGLSLVLAVGMPYWCLASTSTLVQAWLARRRVDARVYHLYGISNTGSILGLLLYPFVIELFLPIGIQQGIWLGGFALFTLLLVMFGMLLQISKSDCANVLHVKRNYNPDSEKPVGCVGIQHTGQHFHVSVSEQHTSSPLLWMGLSMTGTFLLVSATSHLTLDITPLPAMWVIILGAYLLTFVIGFSRVGERLLPLWCLLALGSAMAQAIGDYHVRSSRNVWILISGLGMVFFGGLFLHAWLHARRPPSNRLTRFYLYVAGGGGLGGILGSVVAPLVFPMVWEYPLSVVAVTTFTLLYMVWERPPQITSARHWPVFVLLLVLFFNTATIHRKLAQSVVFRRGFYGLVQIDRHPFQTVSGEEGELFRMLHGSTLHGNERRVGNRRLPASSYFSDFAGGPLSLEQHPRRAEDGFHVGVIGLGVGELLDYARPTDRWRVYEISPEVLELASNPSFFTYVSECPAALQIVLGDARKSLETERQEASVDLFDVLFVDAYSGDAVPFHLVTREAFVLFLDRLAPDGFLVLQMTNWHIDLFPLAKTIAGEFDLHFKGVRSAPVPNRNALAADWVILSRNAFTLDLHPTYARRVNWDPIQAGPLLTDDHGSVLRYLRFDWRNARPTERTAPQDISISDIIQRNI